jgi:hypothetical protein
MPNALPRSFGSVNVVDRIDSAAGARRAPNAPWQARAAIRMPKLAADGRRSGETGHPGQERDLATDQVAEPSAEQQQAAKRQRVGGHHPLPVHGAEAQRPLG